jgi:hypothetical protein
MCPGDGFTYVSHGGGTLTVVGGGAVGSHGGVVVLAATTVVVEVVVHIPVVVAIITVARAANVVLARRARRHQGRRQWSGWHFVGVEHRRSSNWTGGVQVDFLHHGIRLDVEVDDDGVDVRRRSGRGLRGQERRGFGGQLFGGGLPFEIDSGGLLLIKELTSGQDATRASSRCLRTSTSAVGRATMFDGMRSEGEEVEATRASSRYLRASASVAGMATMSDDMTIGGEEECVWTVRGTVAQYWKRKNIGSNYHVRGGVMS